ncbi:hypothetical protein Mro03_81220 [Microbispora rosea subsp. rosea]|nr:hypothetical protein Mro03_81220 [Microbispora rosea subsp. rosea]
MPHHLANPRHAAAQTYAPTTGPARFVAPLTSLTPVTTDDQRDSLARELLRLSLPELVDVLRRVLPAYTEQGNSVPSTLVLAEISWLPGRDPSLTQPFIEAVAWPDRDYYNGGFGPAPANYEQGSCPSCGLEVTSTAKHAFCPLCGTLCQLT